MSGVYEEASQRQRDWDEVDGEKQGAGFRDKRLRISKGTISYS